MSLQLQKIKDKFSDLGKTTQKYGALAGLTVALSFSQVAHSATAEDIRLCEQRWGTCTAEQADLHKDIEADVAGAKTRRAVRAHSYRNPQDIGVFLRRGTLDKDLYPDQRIKDAITRKIHDHFSSLSWRKPKIHFETDRGFNNEGGTVVMYYIGGMQVKCDLDGDGRNPESENIYFVGDSVSDEVLEAVADKHRQINQSWAMTTPDNYRVVSINPF